MLMASHALRHHRADSVHGLTVPPAALMHGDTNQPFDSVSTGSSEDADLVPVQSGKTGLPDLTMIFHNRPKFREIHFVFRPYSERTRCALHYMHGLLQTNFHPGRR